MSEILAIAAADAILGQISRDPRGRLQFAYADSWRASPGSFPLSLSMPLLVGTYPHGVIEPWLWGLLPDNEAVLDRWGRRFHVSPRNAFALLSAVGEDCAGAVQLLRPERVEPVLSGRDDAIEWLSESDIAERLRLLRSDQAAWRIARDVGQFSLAGAQPKTALLFDGRRWGIPSGRTPTTHILKPPITGFDGHAENEYFCLVLARLLGLPAAAATVQAFDGEIAIVVERYDRLRTPDGIHRLHQEDLCQALGLPPTKKYQAEGGPTPAGMIEIVRSRSTAALDDAWTLARALILNWLIAGTDAHAKNFSMLIAAGEVRLAPLYDLASTLAYDFDPLKLRLANRIGGAYEIEAIGPRQWRRFAAEVRLPAERVIDACLDMAGRLPSTLADSARRARAAGLDHPIIERMVERLTARAEKCRRVLLG